MANARSPSTPYRAIRMPIAWADQLAVVVSKFLTEMYLVEVTAPAFSRPRQPNLYGVPLLAFGDPQR